MSKRGRKRKQGVKRTAKGRISRSVVNFDKGTERAQAMQALYGQDGCDAIGRAYRAGFLGQGSDAKAMLDTARRLSNAYWAAYGEYPITCAIGDKTGGPNRPRRAEDVRKREEWLSGCLDRVKALGFNSRASFDALVIDVHPDHGPAFLDRLIFAHRCKRMAMERADLARLDQALEALAMLADVDKPSIPLAKAA